jgi:hypothetical protein
MGCLNGKRQISVENRIVVVLDAAAAATGTKLGKYPSSMK